MRGVEMRLRVGASVVLLAGFPVLVLGSPLVIMVAFGSFLRFAEQLGVLLLFATIPVLWAFGSALKSIWKTRTAPPLDGLELTPEREPLLWAEIHGLAMAMGERSPARLVVDTRVNAAVTERRGRREMVVGLPLLATLTRAELRAVIAHEMGHFAHGHTRGSGFVLRSQYLLQATLRNMNPTAARRLLTFYYRLYSRVSAPVRREHEREADVWAARLAGPEAATRALLQLEVVDPAWRVVTQRYAPMLSLKGPRGSLTDALAAVLDHSGESIRASLARTPPESSPDDSHPPTAERVARLRALPADGVLPLERPGDPAWTWLTDPAARLAEIEVTEVLLGAEMRPSDWQTVLTARTVNSALEAGGQLMGSVQRVFAGTATTLDGLLRILGDGHSTRLVEPLLRGDIPREQRSEKTRRALIVFVEQTVVAVLGQAGRIRVVPDFTPEGPWHKQVLDADGRPMTTSFTPAITAAVDSPSRVPALADLLREAGVDLHAPVKPAEQTVGAIATGALAFARTYLRGPIRRRVKPSGRHEYLTHDVLVYDDGVLARKTPADEKTTPFRRVMMYLAPSRTYEGETQNRIAQLIDQIGDNPETYAAQPANRSVWIRHDTLKAVKIHNPQYIFTTIELILHDGSRVRFLTAPATVVINDPIGTMRSAVS